MQYIQFQPQNPGDVSVAPLGSYNLFIDTNGSISVKNDSGSSVPVGGGGGGAAVQEVTGYSELQTLISGSLLISGALYKINNAASYSIDELGYVQADGVTVFLTAVTSNSFDSSGVGLFWNPNYAKSNDAAAPNEYRVWDTSTQFTYNTPSGGFFYHNENVNWGDNTNIGYLFCNVGNAVATLGYESSVLYPGNKTLWDSMVASIPTTITGSSTGATIQITGVSYSSSYSIGDKVIWGNRVWVNTSGYNGYKVNNMSLGPEDWEVVPFNDTDYTLVANEIQYEYQNNWIIFRKDGKTNNEVSNTYERSIQWYQLNPIGYFPWGHKNIFDCKIEDLTVYGDGEKSFVNFPNYAGCAFGTWNGIATLRIRNATFAASRWGRGTYMFDINLDSYSAFSNHYFGGSTQIYSIYAKQNSGINTIYSYDNDNNYEVLSYIDLYDSAVFSNVAMYSRSAANNVRIREAGNLGSIVLYPSSYLYNINVESEGYVNGLTAGANAYFESMHVETYANVTSVTLGANAGFYEIKLDQDSQLGNFSLGDYAYTQNMQFEMFSYLYGVTLSQYAYIGDLNFGRNSDASFINIGPNAEMYSIQTSENCNIASITLAENSSINSFEMLQGSQMGYFTLDTGSVYSNFLISQNCQIAGGSSLFSGSKSDRVISKNFNNFYDNPILIGSSSFVTNPNELPYINKKHTEQVIDLSGVSYGPVMYYLADGDFEGQTISFLYKSDGTYDGGGSNSPQNLQIWIENARTSLGALQSGASFNWYPFSKDNTSTWRSYAKCVWSDGAWTTDNGAWD